MDDPELELRLLLPERYPELLEDDEDLLYVPELLLLLLEGLYVVPVLRLIVGDDERVVEFEEGVA